MHTLKNIAALAALSSALAASGSAHAHGKRVQANAKTAKAASTARPAPARAAGDRFTADATQQLQTYVELVYRNYGDAYRTALDLQRAVDALIAKPDDATLAASRKAWLAARPSYGQSEAFRFYGGPIDSGKQDDFAAPGLEGLLNAWPLNEAYIDAVRGNPEAGVINGTAPITRATLVRSNARDDEADVTTGYHAIEFLLWGQDFDPNGPGNRSASDFTGDGRGERRRTYLKVATDLLVDNLKTLLDAWAPDQKANYRALVLQQRQGTVVKNMLTGIATLSAFELAAERLATALDSGSQEDEQSCFSDSTHQDILANAVGIKNVYFGEYGDFHGAGINELVAAANPDLNRYLEQQIAHTVTLAGSLDPPFDETLASPAGSPRRTTVEALIKALQIQADLLTQAAAALGVPIAIGDDD
jgi:putative iron-regulated protein